MPLSTADQREQWRNFQGRQSDKKFIESHVYIPSCRYVLTSPGLNQQLRIRTDHELAL